MHFLAALSFSTLCLWAPQAGAFDHAPLGAEEDDMLFMNEEPLEDEELAALRGGFMPTGGLKIDFVYTTRTLLNGDVLGEIGIDSSKLSALNQNDLKQFIQIGQNNTFESFKELTNTPGLVSVIQNSQDGVLIQKFDILDVTVENFSDYRASLSPANAIDFEMSGSVGGG